MIYYCSIQFTHLCTIELLPLPDVTKPTPWKVRELTSPSHQLRFTVVEEVRDNLAGPTQRQNKRLGSP